jgi:hypothetical protein
LKKILAFAVIASIVLSGCSASQVQFKEVLKDCNINPGGLRLAEDTSNLQKGSVEDAAPTNDSVAGISTSQTTLFLDVTSVSDKVGLNIIASQCVMQGLGFSDTTINTIWTDQKTMDGVYKAAVAAYKKVSKELKSSKSNLSYLNRSNADLNALASKWEKSYRADPTCWVDSEEGYYDENDDWVDGEDIYEPCSYDDWLYENEDWEYGDPRKYTSSTTGAKNKSTALETTLEKGVIFPADKLGVFQPVGQDGYAIGWFYSRKQGLVLGISKS